MGTWIHRPVVALLVPMGVQGPRVVLRPSEIVGERYRLDALLGVGSFGYVFRAYDTLDDSTIALKVLRAAGHGALRRFKREFRSCSRLVHPNLVRLYGLSHDARGWLLAMEYVEGCTADRACARPGAATLGFQTSRDSGANPELRSLAASRVKVSPSAPTDQRTQTLSASLLSGHAPDASIDASTQHLSAGLRGAEHRPADPGQSSLTAEQLWTSVGDHSSAIERERERREFDGLIDAFGGIERGPEVRVEFLDVAEQLVSGIAAIHAGGLIHGDIKPANILVRRDGTIKILDFGLASAMRGRSVSSGRIAGTIRYMAPELASAGQSSVASDWYAFGVTLAELFFGWERIDEVGRQDGPLSLSEIVAQLIADSKLSDAPVDPQLAAVVMGCLSPSPKERLQAIRVSSWSSGIPFGVGDPAWPSGPPIPVSDGPEHSSQVGHSSRSVSSWIRDVGEAPLVGRESELEILRQAWRQRDCSRIVLIEGGSGTGKSRLCSALTTEIVAEGHLVLHPRCVPGDAIPSAMFDALLESVAEVLEDDHKLRRRAKKAHYWLKLAQSFDVFAGLQSGALRPRASAPKGLYAEVAVQAFADLLADLAQWVGVAIFVDDIQWADSESAGAYATTLHRLNGARLLFLATSRTDLPVGDFLPRLERDLALLGTELPRQPLPLGGLTPDSAGALLRACLPAGVANGTAMSQVLNLSNGGGGATPWTLTQWALGLSRQAEQGRSEEKSLEATLRDRLADLGGSRKKILQYVACAGDGLELVRLRRLMPDCVDLDSQVADLTAQELVERLTQGQHVVLACRHVIVSEVVRSDLSSDPDRYRRTRKELSVAFACPATRSRRRALARCFEQMRYGYSGRVVRDLARRLGAKLYENLRFEEAARVYDVAAELSAGESGHVDDRVKQAKSCIAAGHLSKLQTIVEEAQSVESQRARVDVSAHDAHALEELILLYVSCVIPASESSKAVRQAEALCGRAGLPWPKSPGACILGFLKAAAHVGMRAWIGLPHGVHPEQASAEVQDWREQVAAQYSVTFGSSDFPRSVYYGMYALSIARDDTNARYIARGMGATVFAVDAFGLPMLKKIREHMVALSRRHRDWLVIGDTHLGECMLGYIQLRVREGLAAAERARRAYSKGGPELRIENYYTDATMLHLLEYAGDYPRLHAEACQLEFDARGMDDSSVAVWGRIYRGYSALAADNIRGAKRCLIECSAGLESKAYSPTHFGVFRLSVYISLISGRPIAALRQLEKEWGALVASRMLSGSVILVHGHYARAMAGFAVIDLITRRGSPVSPRFVRVRRRMLSLVKESARKIGAVRSALAQGRRTLILAMVERIQGRPEESLRKVNQAIDLFTAAEIPLWTEMSRLIYLTWTNDKSAAMATVEELRRLGLANPVRYTELHLPGSLGGFAATKQLPAGSLGPAVHGEGQG